MKNNNEALNDLNDSASPATSRATDVEPNLSTDGMEARAGDDRIQQINAAVADLTHKGKFQEASALILEQALRPTQSEFGFVGVVLGGETLRLLFHEGLKWHETTNREFYENKMRSYMEQHYLDFSESDNLVSYVIKHKEAIRSNSPSTDPRSGGIPAGHPRLHSFLGVPAIIGNEVIGMIGLANRQGGYTQEEQRRVEALTGALCTVYELYRVTLEEGATAGDGGSRTSGTTDRVA